MRSFVFCTFLVRRTQPGDVLVDVHVPVVPLDRSVCSPALRPLTSARPAEAQSTSPGCRCTHTSKVERAFRGLFKLPANPLQRRKIKEHLSSSFLMQI